MRRAVFLDRDGVLNSPIFADGRPYPPATVSELEVLPGVVESCAALRAARFLLIVVSNQPDVARGLQRREAVEAINRALLSQVPLDDIRVCYHDDADLCLCRKPKPGMLLQAAREHGIGLAQSFIVGDRWRDIEAGRQAGCATILIDYGYAEELKSQPDLWVRSLKEAAAWIIAQPRPFHDRR